MGIKKLFSSSKKFISRKRMRGNYRHDPGFQEIMRDPVVGKTLDRPAEQKKFHDRLIEKAADSKLDPHDMRKIAYEAAHGKIEGISNTEGRLIAKAFFPDSSRRYESDKTKSEKSPDSISCSENRQSNSENSSAGKSKKVSPAYFAYRIKTSR